LARKIFFWPISEEVQPGNSVAFLHEVVFYIDRPAWPVQEDSRGEFQKKRFNEAEEIASRIMGAKKQYSSINFLGGFIEGIFLYC